MGSFIDGLRVSPDKKPTLNKEQQQETCAQQESNFGRSMAGRVARIEMSLVQYEFFRRSESR